MASNSSHHLNFSLPSLGAPKADVLSALISLQQQAQAGISGDIFEEHLGQQSPFQEVGGEKECTDFEREAFLEALRELPCLWNVNAHSYKDRTIKNNAWKKLCSMFNEQVPFLQKQLKNLRDMLKKCLDKRNRLSRSGAAAFELPKCQYFEQMAFLHEKSANKPTESNLLPVSGPLGDSFLEDSLPTTISPGSNIEISTPTITKKAPQLGRKRHHKNLH